MLTARGLIEHRVEGLDAGADDYLTKPLGTEELVARLRVVLRRVRRPDGEDVPIATPDFTIHLADGRQLPVLHREFLAFAPSGRTVIVYQPDDSFNVVDLFLVTDLEVKPGTSSATP